jgi:hypothetical protein
MYLLTKSGIRARVYEIQDVYATKEEAQVVADRLNHQTSSKRWAVEVMQTSTVTA